MSLNVSPVEPRGPSPTPSEPMSPNGSDGGGSPGPPGPSGPSGPPGPTLLTCAVSGPSTTCGRCESTTLVRAVLTWSTHVLVGSSSVITTVRPLLVTGGSRSMTVLDFDPFDNSAIDVSSDCVRGIGGERI